jgi:hypothetical protein
MFIDRHTLFASRLRRTGVKCHNVRPYADVFCQGIAQRHGIVPRGGSQTGEGALNGPSLNSQFDEGR